MCYLLDCNVKAKAHHPQKHTETGPDVPQQWLRHGALRDQQQHCRRRITVGTSEPASCALKPMHYCLSKLGSKACYHKNKHLSTANSGGFLFKIPAYTIVNKQKKQGDGS